MENTLLSQSPIGGIGSEFSNNYNPILFRKQPLTDSFIGRDSVALKPQILKAAAYCRVSTFNDIQENSLENQSIHYTKYICSNPNWNFVGIYSDRGKSRTKMESRTGFQRLIRHAIEGKIDLILCKSISRFARNVTDTLNVIRMLKEHGVRVIFDKENIDTNSMQSEFIVTLLAAIAQEESRSISDNVRWSNTKRFERGEAIFTRMLGYTKDNKKTWVVVKEEAEIVKEAFDLYIKGKGLTQIAKHFISKGYKKANGRKDWSGIAVRDILKNEKYVGDVLCQKTYTKDHLSHEAKRNKGNRNQYFIKNHHEAIVDRDTFDKVQELLSAIPMNGQRGIKKNYSLTGRIICGECGGNLQRFICRGLVTWRCGNRVKSKSICSSGGVNEENIKRAIIKAFEKRYKLTNTLKNPFEKHIIQDMIRDLKDAQSIGDIEYNKFKMELERILFEENMIILKAEDNSKAEFLKIKRTEIEEKLKERENWWDMLEKDNIYRVTVLEKLEFLSRINNPFNRLKEYLNEIEFLRAWVVRIRAYSPISFSIEWLDGQENKVCISNLKR